MLIDDSSLYISKFSEVCTRCKFLNRESIIKNNKTCSAFPKKIPDEIWQGKNLHAQPYPGDNGIQFSLHPDAKPYKRT